MDVDLSNLRVVEKDRIVRQTMNQPYTKEYYAEMDLESAFDFAKAKYLNRCSKPGNTIDPWKTCSIEWLEKRLDDEIAEYKASKKCNELLDIINLAAFVYLAQIEMFTKGNKKVKH